MSITVEPPARLPVEHLSVSSLKLLAECPIRWKRRYIDRVYEPPSGKMLLGSAVGAAEAQHYSEVIDTGEGYTVEQVTDEFSAEWEDRIGREEVEWGDDKPGLLKDSGVLALEAYHLNVAPNVVPVTVERKFELSWPGLDWTLEGYLDLEEADGAVSDLKVRGKKMMQLDANADIQPTSYLFARRAEGQAASEFRFHTMVRTKAPYAEVVTTRRTDRQLDWFADRVFLAASEIAWRAENEAWSGAAPSSWMCSSKFCGFWSSCEFGGMR